MRVVVLSTLFLVAAASVAGCGKSAPTTPIAGHGGDDSADKSTVTLYEGLPHGMFERALLESEKKDKKTVEKHGEPFYAEVLTLKDGDAERLEKLVAGDDGFKPFSGEKKCGGFHPDYAVEFKNANRTRVVLVCFGCGEVKVYNTDGAESRFDMSGEMTSALKALLKPYRKNRPAGSDGV